MHELHAFKHWLSKGIDNISRFTFQCRNEYSKHAFDAKSIMLQNALVQLGLSDKEASTYIMLLRIGTSPVSSLAKRLDMKRVTLYSVLDSLAKKGYVTFQKQGTCRRYIAHDPECILEDLERKSDALKRQVSLAKECVKKLQTFPRSTESQPKQSEVIFGEDVEERLNREVSLDQALFIISMSTPMNPLIRKLVERSSRQREEVHICLKPGLHEKFNGVCDHIKFYTLVLESRCISGDLIIQKDKVLFLSYENEDRLTIQVDQSYSRLLIELFKFSYLPNH